MKKQRIPTTLFRCLLFPKGLILLAALWIALGLAGACQSQSLQPLHRGQPFPYGRGMAMDSVLYSQVKAKLDAAENLRTSAAQSLASLKQQVAASQQALEAQQALIDHDARTLDSLRDHHQILTQALKETTDSLASARRQFSQVLARLPRSFRQALRDAPTHQLARVIADYITTQRKRKWYWLGIGSGVGMVGGLVGSLLLIAR